MRKLMMALAISATALLGLPSLASASEPITDFSSQIYIGPGGVQIGDGHGRYRSHRRWGSERVAPRVSCRELRYLCRSGVPGDGNCRRYRRLCG